MTTPLQFQLNLNHKGITNFDEILPLLSNVSQLKELDLSNNNLTSLPSNLSSFSNLSYLNLSHNKFTDYNTLSKSLSTLPNLRELKIDLFKGEDAYLILSNLPNLKILNSKSTKTNEPQNIININETEINYTSFKNEIPNFNNITKRIISKLQNINQPTDTFYNKFQSLFKTQIDLLSNLNENIPNYIYTSHVLSAKNEIYRYLQCKIMSMLSLKVDNDIMSILNDVNESMYILAKNSIELIEVIWKEILQYKE